MTMLYLDGFAHGDTSRYSGSAPNSWALTTSKRTPGTATYYASTNAQGDIKRAVTASAEIVTGFGTIVASTQAALPLLSLWGDSGATQHLTLCVTAAGLLEVRRGSGSGTVLATGSTVLNMSGWHYYEVRATIADTGGVCQVWVDGAATPEIDYSGDTKNTGTNTTIDAVSLRSNNYNPGGWYADWYILNTAGTVNNARLGDIVVRTLVPTGDGASSQLVGSDSDSTNNWQLVDELPTSSTDYVGSGTSSAVDTYAMTDLPAGTTSVFGVQVAGRMAKSDAGAATGKLVTRVGSTNYVPDTTTLSTSYAWAIKTWDVDPTGAAWTPTTVNAMETGMQVG